MKRGGLIGGATVKSFVFDLSQADQSAYNPSAARIEVHDGQLL
jgi:hypothetical protein